MPPASIGGGKPSLWELQYGVFAMQFFLPDFSHGTDSSPQATDQSAATGADT